LFPTVSYVYTHDSCNVERDKARHKVKGSQKTNGGITIITALLNLHKEIWANHNTHIHGKTREEQQAKARVATIQQVWNIYQKPPTLAK
jgi:hypothetical protein